MLCLPEMFSNIIVGLKWKGRFGWYVSYKEMWFLDETLLIEEYAKWAIEKGLPPEPQTRPDDVRYHLPILSEKNVDEFLPRIAKYSAATNELREYLMLAMEYNSRTDVFYEYIE